MSAESDEDENKIYHLKGGTYFRDVLHSRLMDVAASFVHRRLDGLGFRLTRVRSPLERLAEAGQEVNRGKG